MKLLKYILLVTLVSALVLSAQASPDDHYDIATVNPYCPVSPEETIDPEVHIEFEGKQVYFCCNRCRKKFLADPDAYRSNIPQLDAVADDGHAHDHALVEPISDAHDHASDHGSAETSAKPIRFLGKFHPLVVHFPIALILVALFSEGVSLWKKKVFYSEAARYALSLGALSAVIAAILGWIAASGSSYPSELRETLFYHRWIGTTVAVLSVVTLGFAILKVKIPRLVVVYRFMLVLCAMLVGAAGHLGALLIYGAEYFSW